MIDQLNKVTPAVVTLRFELAKLAAMQNSETGPEDLVDAGDTFMDVIETKLKTLLSQLGDQYHLDRDSMRNLVFGGDAVCVSFYGQLGAGCLLLRPDADHPVALEDWSCDRALSKFWSFVESLVQFDDDTAIVA